MSLYEVKKIIPIYVIANDEKTAARIAEFNCIEEIDKIEITEAEEIVNKIEDIENVKLEYRDVCPYCGEDYNERYELTCEEYLDQEETR
jgi:heptaprenylglyceryl phosphate synthase